MWYDIKYVLRPNTITYTAGKRRSVSKIGEQHPRERRETRICTIEDGSEILHLFDIIICGSASWPDLRYDFFPEPSEELWMHCQQINS
jgi:hypothetical protein